MPDPSTYRPATGTIPVEPGVYRFRDDRGRVIYVGKAKSLRQRLNSYFADLSALHPRTRQMVTSAAGVEWTTVSTEVEALQLEYNWIKEFDPRFNVRYRDDKSYPSLAVTLYEQYPRLQVMRGPKRKGVRYFGPYAHAWAIRETLDLLLRVFPARTCSAGVFKRAQQVGRPCLLGYIGKCSAPCVGRVSAEEHRDIVDDFCDFMAGQTDTLIRRLEKEMTASASELDFERAARLRDDVGALRRAMEKQAVVFGDGTDADVVAFAQDELEAGVQVFHVRGGRVRGQRGWTIDKAAWVDGSFDDQPTATAALVEQFVTQFYGDESEVDGAGNAIPREVLVPELPADVEALSEWLSQSRGSRVTIRVPQRGDKRALMETVARNAGQAFAQHKLKRASDLTARSQAISELQEQLSLVEAPLRIECFDISHNQGTDVVASMVVFEDGLARKSEYRRFAMRETGGDTDWIAEAVRRRFARYLESQAAPLGVAGEEVDGAPHFRGQPPLRLPTQPGRRRRRTAAGQRRPGGAGRPRDQRRRHRRAGQAAGRGVGARRGISVDPAAHLRVPVPAPTRPRRGAPVRHHLPPPEALQVDDRLGVGRRRRSRRAPAQGADGPFRLAWPVCGARTSPRSWPCPASAGRPRRRSLRRSGASSVNPNPVSTPPRVRVGRAGRRSPLRRSFG